jgi:NADH-quinone oxidoreductase subunit J
MTTALFLAFAGLALLFGLLVAALRHPLYAALSLVGVIGCLSVLFYLLGATFLAMVLFLFVIMLLDLKGEARQAEAHPVQKGMALVLFASFLCAGVGTVLVQKLPLETRLVKPGVGDLGRMLFTRYLLPFEAVTLLLLAAAVGAFLLARKEWK